MCVSCHAEFLVLSLVRMKDVMNGSKTRQKCWTKIVDNVIKTEILEEMCKEYHKVKDKGSEETTAFHLPGNPPVNGCSSYFSRVMPNRDYRLQQAFCFCCSSILGWSRILERKQSRLILNISTSSELKFLICARSKLTILATLNQI